MSTPPRIWLSPPDMGQKERDLLLEAFDSNWIAPLGPQVDAFERELAQVTQTQDAAALSSGTAALHLALHLLGVGPGDEVLVPTLTFAATANAVKYMGANPVFIDSTEESWNIDPLLVEEELKACAKRGKIPKALIGVDLYGQCADWDALQSICQRYEVPLVEDAAEALGASYKGRAAGGLADLGVLSFNGNKIISTSGGGALLVHDRSLGNRARFLASQAKEPAAHYEHREIGFNYRLSNLLAAVGRGQLESLEDKVASRQRHNLAYRQILETLPGIKFQPEAPGCISTFWLSCITIEAQHFGIDREGIRLALEAQNIEARPVWKPMHLQPVFRDARTRGGSVAERLFEDGLCLPSGSGMSAQERDRVIAAVLEASPFFRGEGASALPSASRDQRDQRDPRGQRDRKELSDLGDQSDQRAQSVAPEFASTKIAVPESSDPESSAPEFVDSEFSAPEFSPSDFAPPTNATPESAAAPPISDKRQAGGT